MAGELMLASGWNSSEMHPGWERCWVDCFWACPPDLAG